MVLVEDYIKKLDKNKELKALMRDKQLADSFYLDILDFKKGLEKAGNLKITYNSFSNDLQKKLTPNTGSMISHLTSSAVEDLNKCKSIIQNVYDFITPTEMVLSDNKHKIFEELLETNVYKNNTAVHSVLFDSVPVSAQVFEYNANNSTKNSEESDLGKIVNLSLLANNNFKELSNQVRLIDNTFEEYVRRNKNLEYFSS